MLKLLIGDGAGRTLILKVLRPTTGALSVVHIPSSRTRARSEPSPRSGVEPITRENVVGVRDHGERRAHEPQLSSGFASPR
jgi:hypothetical protein